MITAKPSTKSLQAFVNNSPQNTIAKNIRVCDSFGTRLRGLLGTKKLASTEACWIKPCNSIHTISMKYSIDAYFLDKTNHVIAIKKDMKPNRLSRIIHKAHSVLEFSANDKLLCSVGDQINFKEAQE